MNNTNYFNNNNNIQQINQTNLNIEELFEKYVNDCQNLISEYEKKMENYIFNPSLNNDNNDLILNLINEKNTVNNKIQNGQEEIKNCLGFYPDLTEFNSKISKYLNLVLDKKIKEIQDKRQNYNNKKQMNNNFINNKSSNKKNNNMNDNKLRNNSNNNFNNSQNKNSILNSLTQSQLNKKIKECQYRSKYEDLRKSIFKNEDINKDLMQSLSGWSKFITPKNNINMSNNNFYQTWKDNNSNVSSNIKSDKNEEKKSIEYNIPDDEFLMSEKNDNYNNKSISNSNSKQNKNNNILNNNINNNRKMNSSKNNNIHNSNNNNQIKIKTNKENIKINNNNNLNKKNKNKINNKKSINSSEMSNKDNNISEEEYQNKDNNNNNNSNNKIKQIKLDSRISAKIIENEIKISKDEKEKSFLFEGEQEQNSLMNNTNKIENSNMRISNELKNRKSFHGSPENINNITRNLNSKDNIIINDLDDDSCNIDINLSKKEENEKFEIINNPDLENNKNKNNINNYKEIQESQKLQNQLNFFEDSMLENKVIKTSNKQKVRRPSSPKGKNSQSKKNEIENNYNNNINNNELPVDSLLSSKNLCNDSYGDNIINDLNKFRKLALEESSISNYKK